jgi:hypothetical protein
MRGRWSRAAQAGDGRGRLVVAGDTAHVASHRSGQAARTAGAAAWLASPIYERCNLGAIVLIVTLQFLGRRVEDMHSFFRQLIVLPSATGRFGADDGIVDS